MTRRTDHVWHGDVMMRIPSYGQGDVAWGGAWENAHVTRHNRFPHGTDPPRGAGAGAGAGPSTLPSQQPHRDSLKGRFVGRRRQPLKRSDPTKCLMMGVMPRLIRNLRVGFGPVSGRCHRSNPVETP